jgi:hypothetical protein
VTLINSFTEDILNKKAIIMYRPIPGMRFISRQGYKFVKYMHKDFDKKLYAEKEEIISRLYWHTYFTL